MRHPYILCIAMAAGLLAAVSCRKEDTAAAVAGGETETVTLDFCLDASLTKADEGVSSFGSGELTGDHLLVWEVYLEDSPTAAPVMKGTQPVTADGIGKLDITLAKENEYSVVFFLYNTKSDKDAFDLSGGLGQIEIDYSKHEISNDAYDIFCASVKVDPTEAKNLSVTLRRPLAQINVADQVADWASKNDYHRIKISLTAAGTVLDASSGIAEDAGDISYKEGGVSGYEFGVVPDYFLRSMIYVLPTEEPTDIIIEFIGNGSTATLIVEDVILTPNTRINILADDLISLT